MHEEGPRAGGVPEVGQGEETLGSVPGSWRPQMPALMSATGQRSQNPVLPLHTQGINTAQVALSLGCGLAPVLQPCR